MGQNTDIIVRTHVFIQQFLLDLKEFTVLSFSALQQFLPITLNIYTVHLECKLSGGVASYIHCAVLEPSNLNWELYLVMDYK